MAIPTHTGFLMLRLKISPRVIILGLEAASIGTTSPAGVGYTGRLGSLSTLFDYLANRTHWFTVFGGVFRRIADGYKGNHIHTCWYFQYLFDVRSEERP